MKLLRYQEELVKKHKVKLEEPVNGHTDWVRVQKNGKLLHWKPLRVENTPIESLNGVVIQDPGHELEINFRKSRYNER